MTKFLNAAANLGLLFASILVVELFLQALETFGLLANGRVASPTQAVMLDDPVLGKRGNPDHSEHDARGFRNPAMPDRAAIVALGDSHTYGTSVPPEATWTRLLANATESTVYNMGHGGYGASHNLANLPVALSLNPRCVLFGLYFGNDFYDDFLFAQHTGRLDAYVPQTDLAVIERLEREEPIKDSVSELFAETLGRDSAAEDAEQPRAGLGSLLAQSKLVQVIEAAAVDLGLFRPRAEQILFDPDFDAIMRSMSERERRHLFPVEVNGWRTLLTIPYRARVLDREDRRIAAGIKVSIGAIAEMSRRVAAHGADFAVILMPTKAFVFAQKQGRDMAEPMLSRLAVRESAIRSQIMAELAKQSIRIIDPVPALLASDRQPYFVAGDGHPNALGHRIIASTIRDALPCGANGTDRN